MNSTTQRSSLVVSRLNCSIGINVRIKGWFLQSILWNNSEKGGKPREGCYLWMDPLGWWRDMALTWQRVQKSVPGVGCPHRRRSRTQILSAGRCPPWPGCHTQWRWLCPLGSWQKNVSDHREWPERLQDRRGKKITQSSPNSTDTEHILTTERCHCRRWNFSSLPVELN